MRFSAVVTIFGARTVAALVSLGVGWLALAALEYAPAAAEPVQAVHAKPDAQPHAAQPAGHRHKKAAAKHPKHKKSKASSATEKADPAPIATGEATPTSNPVTRGGTGKVAGHIDAALAAARAAHWGDAERRAAASGDLLVVKLVKWMELSRPGVDARFREIADFVEANSDWPLRDRLIRSAEAAIDASVSDTLILDWFDRHPPLTGMGKFAYAEALLRAGDQARSYDLMREAWVGGDIDVQTERAIRERYRAALSDQTNFARADRLLWDGRIDPARRLLPNLPAPMRAVVEARIRLMGESPGVERALDQVPAELANDPGLMFERLRWRRRQGWLEGASNLLLNAPVSVERPAAWWRERSSIARQALSAGDISLAYKLASNYGDPSGPPLADAEWLSGWILFRSLNEPRAALAHFEKIYEAAKLPVSKARGAYWAGRAAAAIGDTDSARRWFGTAAGWPTTYYGQLGAVEMIRLGEAAGMPLPLSPKPELAEEQRFADNELVRAVRLLVRTGNRDRVDPFVRALSSQADTPGEHALVGDLAVEIARPDLAIAVAKRASYDGVSLIRQGYPITALPTDNIRTPRLESPLLYAIIRQESAFGVDAISSAGAKGLMQIMPSTARGVAREIKLPYSTRRLNRDARYNLTLGSVYMRDLLDDFDGSYVMALAAYNAGPTRVRKWQREFGDPRSGAADPIDWVESIPLDETRDYVQRVIENLQVYRRLADAKSSLAGQPSNRAVGIERDLHIARRTPTP